MKQPPVLGLGYKHKKIEEDEGEQDEDEWVNPRLKVERTIKETTIINKNSKRETNIVKRVF